MKKSNTNAGHDKNKKGISSTPKIQHFFKNASKLSEVGKKIKPKDNDNTKAVYIELLNEKLQELEKGSETEPREAELVGASAVVIEKEIKSAASGIKKGSATEQRAVEPVASAVVIQKEIESAEVVQTSQRTAYEDWENKYKILEKDYKAHITGCQDWESKYKNLKKDYMKLGTKFAELRMQHDDLLTTKAYTHTNPSDINDVASSSDSIFTPSEVLVLRNMPLDQTTDSTFILKCLKFAYKQDISVLRNKTLKGKSEAMVISGDGDVAFMPGKDPLSPQKIEPIRSLFVERINKCKLKPAAYDKRIKDAYMNKLIASGITNIVKNKKGSQ